MKSVLVLATGLVTLTAACSKEDTCGDDYARADDGNCYPINAEEEDDADGGIPDSGNPDGETTGGETTGGATTAGGDDGDVIEGEDPLPCETDADCPSDLICDSTGICAPDGDDPDGGDDDGGEEDGGEEDEFEITDECGDELFTGTTAAGSLRDWTGGGGTISFASAAWRWTGTTDTASVLVTQAEDSCGDVIADITAGTYTDAAAYIEISNWTELGPGSLSVLPLGAGEDDDPRVSASAYYYNSETGEGTSWPLDGYTGAVGAEIYGVIEVLFVEAGMNFEGNARLFGGGPGEGVDGIFNACYCAELEDLAVPGEVLGEGGDGPPIGEGEEPIDAGGT